MIIHCKNATLDTHLFDFLGTAVLSAEKAAVVGGLFEQIAGKRRIAVLNISQ
jgi:hypothetical protein